MQGEISEWEGDKETQCKINGRKVKGKKEKSKESVAC